MVRLSFLSRGVYGRWMGLDGISLRYRDTVPCIPAMSGACRRPSAVLCLLWSSLFVSVPLAITPTDASAFF